MVDMTHNGHNRRTRYEIALVVLLLAHGFLHLCTDVLGLEAKLLSHHVDGLSIETLVDGGHDTNAHQRGDDLRHGNVHHRSQLRHGNELGELQYLALLLLLTCLGVELLLYSLTLLLAVLGTTLVLRLAGETCQRLLYLTCHVLLVHLQGLLRAVAVFLLLTVVLASLLVGSGIDIHLIIIDALALAMIAIGPIVAIGGILLALLLTLAAQAPT